MNNVVVAVFSGTTSTRTRRLWKIDKGMLLQLVGLNLPAAYQVHFSNNPDSGQATVVVATSDMVEIPYKYLQTGDDIYAWVYLTPENGIGYTIYMVTIPVRVRPDILIEDPSEEQQNVVDSAIAALNSAVEQTAADVSAANEYAANAEAAQIGAEAAKTAAEAAQAESEINATSAAQNAAAAGQYASNANHYADTAEFHAEQAAQSAQNAANKASVAETSADEALLSARAASEAYNAADEAKDISIQASNAAKDYLRDANAAATNSEIYAGAASDKADQAAQNAANASENAIIAQQAKNEAEAAQSAAEAARDTAISNAQTTIANANVAGRNADAAAESAELAASYLDTAISALNSGVESVQAAVAGVQDSIDTALQEAKDSGEFDGADGYTPVKGVDYFDGEKGDTGDTGETGNGIASAVLNADYTLTLTYTDGTTWTSGSIRGERGDKGETGADGYSPAATVTQTETGATVTVTDKTGTTTAEISNGQDGTTFTPAVSAEGVISWTNDGGKTNPQPVNIKGPQGDDYILTATDKEEIAQQVAVSLSPALDEKAPVIYCEASGAIASFTDGADDLPVQDLVVQIEPVQAGSGDPSPTNVRPISGWTGANVTRCGKNLISYPYGFTTNTVNSCTATVHDDGTITFSGTPTANTLFNIKARTYTTGGYAQFLPGGTYKLNGTPQGGSASTFQISVINVYGTPIAIDRSSDPEFTIPDGGMNVGVQLFVANGYNPSSLVLKPMIRVASNTDAAYEPYQGSTLSVTFPSAAGTVYGGSLDVTTGVLTVDRAEVDLGTLTWSYNSTRTRFETYGVQSTIKPATNNNTPINALCESYKIVPASAVQSTDFSIGVTNIGAVLGHDSRYSDADAYKSAVSGVQLISELATPQTYQLTPTEVRTLLGQNSIWANTGDAAVTYRADTKMFVEQNAPVTSVNGSTGAVVLSIPSTAADVGAIAAPASPATGSFLVWSGSAWTAQTLSTWQGGSY